MQRATSNNRRKALLAGSLIINLGLLCFFKYFGFFVESFADFVRIFGFRPNIHTLKIILPVGISFYTFQTLSYTIDIYRKRIKATNDFIAFFAFVSFFPQLVAGPIERARNLLPQFQSNRTFDLAKAKDGVHQILWGLFKKVVIADNLGVHVDNIYSDFLNLNGSILVLGTLYFAIQIYCDFSGYSDMAIGTGRLLGFRLTRNFAFPYFSRDISEFWRRWHISLSSWFRDYVYIPLGGNRTGKIGHIRNILLTFIICGLWHGANWTFIIWGLLNGLYFVPLIIAGKQKKYNDIVAKGKLLPSLYELLQMGTVFVLTLFGWIFFRAESLGQAFEYIGHMCSYHLFIIPKEYRGGLVYVVFILIVEWFQRSKLHGLQIETLSVKMRWTIYYVFIVSIFMHGKIGYEPFIYFQF